MSKISIRFYNNKEVRAVWDEVKSKWWFSADAIDNECVQLLAKYYPNNIDYSYYYEQVD